jgi:TolB-like protein
MKLRTLLTTATIIALSACASSPVTSSYTEPKSVLKNSSNPFIATNYKAADVLIEQLGDKLNTSQPMIVATIVNIDDLNSSSTFGRTVSEQVSARFSQATYNMIEMKFRSYVFMKQDQGELLLTREIRDVANNHNAQGVIVGTYSLSNNSVYVNLKVIQPNTNIVLAGHDYAFPMDGDVKSMTKAITRR